MLVPGDQWGNVSWVCTGQGSLKGVLEAQHPAIVHQTAKFCIPPSKILSADQENLDIPPHSILEDRVKLAGLVIQVPCEAEDDAEGPIHPGVLVLKEKILLTQEPQS